MVPRCRGRLGVRVCVRVRRHPATTSMHSTDGQFLGRALSTAGRHQLARWSRSRTHVCSSSERVARSLDAGRAALQHQRGLLRLRLMESPPYPPLSPSTHPLHLQPGIQGGEMFQIRRTDGGSQGSPNRSKVHPPTAGSSSSSSSSPRVRASERAIASHSVTPESNTRRAFVPFPPFFAPPTHAATMGDLVSYWSV